ncbi:MAG: mechanosensitive ion channel family protein [Planctomycetota bacterium]
MKTQSKHALITHIRSACALAFSVALAVSTARAEEAPKAIDKAVDITVAFFTHLKAEIANGRTHYLFFALIATIALLRMAKSGGVQRVRGIVLIYLSHVIVVPIAGLFAAYQSALYIDAQFLSIFFAILAAIFMAETLIFDLFLPWFHFRAPRLLRDLVLAGASFVAVIYALRAVNTKLENVFATSAILSAVIGFSMQDTLGNIMGGLSLTLDNSIAVGDWIKVNDPTTPINGRVVMIRWRYTAVETRNWETIIVPNSILMKGQVLVLGRRSDKPQQWRRWVYFNVDFRFAPSKVIEVVEHELRSGPIERVAADPQINCICTELGESSARYGVRYWLTDIATDDPTDSSVRCRIYVALKRAGIPLSIPAQSIVTTRDESAERRGQLEPKNLSKRQQALAGVDLFKHMTDAERLGLANTLVYSPFTKNEILTKQGATAHWLYIIMSGVVSVRVTLEGKTDDVEVAQIGSGHFFGEMSLMTGETRSATVIALTDVECYRLDKAAFQTIITERPELAEEIAVILAQRKVGLEAARTGRSSGPKTESMESITQHVLSDIKRFFGLEDFSA